MQLKNPTINFTCVLQFLIYGPGIFYLHILFWDIVFAFQVYILKKDLENNNSESDSYFSLKNAKFKSI